MARGGAPGFLSGLATIECEVMGTDTFGIEELVDEDRAYRGSRFAEVRDAVFGQPYAGTFDTAGRMPTYAVTFRRMVYGLLKIPFGRWHAFRQASARAVDSHADLRWGPDRKGFRRLVHPNGICLSGMWEITEPTDYSGYFAGGSKGLVVGRYSTCCTETRRGHARSLALAGKLFPTTDPEHPAPLRTASFITQEDIGGDHTSYINDAELRNAPNTSSWRRGSGMPVLLITFDNAAASYNGDFVLHFQHPTWRTDRNDPATATRVGERKK